MYHRTKTNVNDVLKLLDKKLKNQEDGLLLPFSQFLVNARSCPEKIFRNVFQLFNNMIYYYIEESDEYKNDPESINYKTINSEKLFVDKSDHPFFADLPLANRLVRLADSFKDGAQQNKIYIFIGPPGSGKSTFLNNLLQKFQEYTHTPEGLNYEVLWKLEFSKLRPNLSSEIKEVLDGYYHKQGLELSKKELKPSIIDIHCPSHDHPILIIPKEHRAEILEELLHEEAKKKIFNKKEYAWIFKNNPCTICMSIYQTLSNKLQSPVEVFDMLYAKRYFFDRRLGDGISVYNPADTDSEKPVITNDEIQKELSGIFKDSNLVRYVYSRFAKTNNGVFVIMDIKGHNEKRFLDLHGIISEGIHKIEDIEENVNSLFIAVMNPEDKSKIHGLESFMDRVNEINVNYVLNYTEEVKIYYNSFGSQINKRFLPGVLENFAKIIISSRLNPQSPAIREWIKKPEQYKLYCDDNLLLLKMGIYSNLIPSWLTEEDVKRLDKEMRKKIINESEQEGRSGFSGRESINIFNDFYNFYKKYKNESGVITLITMEDVKEYFYRNEKFNEKIPVGFIDSIIRLYDYNIMQDIKESLFRQNEERISKDLQNYLFASSYDIGEKRVCPYTNETIEITDQFFYYIEQHLLPADVNSYDRKNFRERVELELTVNLQSMDFSTNSIQGTKIYKELHSTYMNNLRKNIFQPFLKYTSFENAIKEFGTPKYEVYDKRTKDEVTFLINNLIKKFNYSLEGAKQVCLYVINKKIAERFIT